MTATCACSILSVLTRPFDVVDDDDDVAELLYE